MTIFKDQAEARAAIGGFLDRFPGLTPVLAEVCGHEPLVLKLDLVDPPLSAEVDMRGNPIKVTHGADSEGTVAMSGPADNFHRLLLGLDPLGVSINQKKLLVRGSTARLVKAARLFYLAPVIYPFHLQAIGRPDLIIQGPRPPAHGEIIAEDFMNAIVTKLAYLVGWSLGLIKARVAPSLDVFAALESMGRGLLSGSGNGGE